MKCTYRRGTDCRFPRRMMNENTDTTCKLCLMGQLIESTELNTSAMMEKSMDRLEAEVIPISDRLKEALDDLEKEVK